MRTFLLHVATAITTLVIVRVYLWSIVMPAASQQAFIERTKDLAELISHLDQRYVRYPQTNSFNRITVKKD